MQWLTFPSETIDRLFEAVDTDDVVDEHVMLPESVVLQGDDDEMRRCYSLCLQFWQEGVSRKDLLRYVKKLLAGGDLTKQERRHYKHMRARYKHLRYAQRLYSHNHKAFFLFGYTTFILGELQDAFRNHQTDKVFEHAKRMKWLLRKPVWSLVNYQMTHTRLDTTAGILAYRMARMQLLKEGIKKSQVDGHEFHDMRKVIGQQVSYYDTLRSLAPDNVDAFRMSRFLSAINGLMGDRHDEMVAEAMDEKKSYEDLQVIEADTAWRLRELVERFFSSSVGSKGLC